VVEIWGKSEKEIVQSRSGGPVSDMTPFCVFPAGATSQQPHPSNLGGNSRPRSFLVVDVLDVLDVQRARCAECAIASHCVSKSRLHDSLSGDRFAW
jgi:hypothetical protein